MSDDQRNILADPQTSGGLLVAIEEEHCSEFESILAVAGLPPNCRQSFGVLSSEIDGPLIRLTPSATQRTI
jgi:selenide,water dikinase